VGGTVPDSQTAERVEELAMLAVGGDGKGVKNQLVVAGVQQTMLRVVVAEVVKEALRELSVNWAIGGNEWSRDFFFANNLNQLNPTIFSSSGLPNVLFGQNAYSVGGVGNGPNANVTFGFPRGEFQMFINALREDNLARVLAEPNLVAISGQTATFLAGGEVPIPVTQGGAVAGSITIEYKEFGVRLAFTPTVLAGQIVRLHVMTEVSDAIPGAAVGGLPTFSFTTRRVESTIECGNGQTFAIAGLLREQVRALADKLPALGDIPVIGALFSSTMYQRSNTEMVVLVTPQLVEPLDPQQVPPPPGALMTEPNDYELFALQKLEGEPMPYPNMEGVPREDVPVNLRPMNDREWTTSQLALLGPWGLAEFEEN
jgi:pilus assembly protein CpaC